jgi:hypothetical protein
VLVTLWWLELTFAPSVVSEEIDWLTEALFPWTLTCEQPWLAQFPGTWELTLDCEISDDCSTPSEPVEVTVDLAMLA